MAVGFIAGSTSNSTAASYTVAAPAGAAVGDLALAVVQTASATTVTLSAGAVTNGWQQLGVTYDFASSTRSSAVFYKRLTGTGDTGTVNFGATVGNHRIQCAYRGVDSTAPINDHVFSNDSDSSGTSVPASALSTSATSRVAVIGMSAGQAMNAPSNSISRATSSANGNSNFADIGPDYSAGTLGGWSFTGMGASVRHAAWSIALKEDSARQEPAWEATSQVTTGGTPAASLPIGAGIPASQNGDLLLAQLMLSSTSVAVNSVPGGWSLIDSTLSGQCRLYTYQKVYDGTTTNTFGFDGSSTARCLCHRYTSPHPSTPVGTTAENSGLVGTTVTFPALTPSGDGLLHYAGASGSSANQTNAATTPTGATERGDNAGASASGSQHVFGGTNGNVSSGVATSTFTSTLTNSADWAAQTIVLASLPVPPAAPTGLTALVTQS